MASRSAGGEQRRGSLFYQLLVATLDAALPLPQMDNASMGVAQHLDLDVTRMVQVTLQIDRTIPERGFRLPAGGFECPASTLRALEQPACPFPRHRRKP